MNIELKLGAQLFKCLNLIDKSWAWFLFSILFLFLFLAFALKRAMWRFIQSDTSMRASVFTFHAHSCFQKKGLWKTISENDIEWWILLMFVVAISFCSSLQSRHWSILALFISYKKIYWLPFLQHSMACDTLWRQTYWPDFLHFKQRSTQDKSSASD